MQRLPDTSGIYQPGDDVLFTLPTGRPVDEHAVIVNFSHRFAYDSAVTRHRRGGAESSSAWTISRCRRLACATASPTSSRWTSGDRPPSSAGPSSSWPPTTSSTSITRNPFNLAFRVSVEGQDNFRKNYTENIGSDIFAQPDFARPDSTLFRQRRSMTAGWCRGRSIPMRSPTSQASTRSRWAPAWRWTFGQPWRCVAEVIPTVCRRSGARHPPAAVLVRDPKEALPPRVYVRLHYQPRYDGFAARRHERDISE